MEIYIKKAIELAHHALPQDVPVGAIIVGADGRILAEAYNRREIDNNPVGHAEMLALQEAAKQLGQWRLSDCTVYVTLEPCPMCASAIAQSRIGKVVFGAYDPVLGACGSRWNLLEAPVEVPFVGGILESECQDLLVQFFKNKR